ncbi:MAG TPA: excinuclease ABC subunit UvrC [Candidatus Monoglobus merdigallinarum]|uniref:UvrABC system protein C n=1 Tax=Candidatus Monoglobus merdigallinarum TaxID=2838698 RepID=A0A9D1PQ44_9FIRM|nr:excinuclease ABC subunit UvrC [Candidatus Monoglobus merdigallinarum]
MNDEVMNRIKSKLKSLPLAPGVYLMKNRDGKIIYVGKSKALKNRVSSYFINSKGHTLKTRKLVENVYDFDYILTDSEVEALILECNLIKKHMPKYNILLKDDKQYPYIKITAAEAFPRIFITRRLLRDGSKYFGPYMSAMNTKETLELIKKIFKIRTCSKQLPQEIGKGRPCLYYQIGQCSAPCDGRITQEEYSAMFDKIADVLSGNYDELEQELKNKMLKAADNLEFERAAGYRDSIQHLKALGEKQKIVSSNYENRDIVGMFCEDKDYCVQIFYMRSGKIIGSENYVFENSDDSAEELISGFLKQFYFSVTDLPREVLLPVEIDDREEIGEWLTQKSGRKVNVHTPKRGEKARSVEMANKNASESLKLHKFKRNRDNTNRNKILKSLMDTLSLEKLPSRIESYDISNISGAQSVGVCVVYNNALPRKSAYRKFTVKTVEGADDYESTREVIFRRINRAYKEMDDIAAGTLTEDKAKFLPLPDLILLDGGKGHVSTVKELFETMGEDIPVFGMVKDDKHRTRGLTDEHHEIDVGSDSELFRFLCAVQEEVHRFAVTSFRKKFEKAGFHSVLDEIKGVGAARRNKLLLSFSSINRIKNAELSELEEVVDKTTAKNVYDYFHSGGDKQK